MEIGSNLRIESFGSTLFDLTSGKRVYLDKAETKSLSSLADFSVDNHNFPSPILVNQTKIQPTNGFAFADTAFIEITRRCNLRCSHCLNNSGKELENTLGYNEIMSLIDNLARAGVQEIRFTGGEPLLHPNIINFIKNTTRNGVRASIGTNGTLITPRLAEDLKRAGLKQAVVSLDGTEYAHDNIRGKGNFKKALAGVKNLQDAGILIRINSVLMRNNYKDIIALMKELDSRQLPTFIRRFIESGRGQGKFSQVLSKQDYDKVREDLRAEIDGKYIRGHYLRDLHVAPRIQLPFERRACSAGQRGLVILPNGNLHSCGFLAAQGEKPLGNVRDVKDWSLFWKEVIDKDHLKPLREELAQYNKRPGVQPTTCMAYVAYKLKENQK